MDAMAMRWVLLGLLAGGTASAQGTMGLIASGDCRDADLLGHTRLIVRELKVKLGDRLIHDDVIRARLAPQAGHSAEDLGRQLEAAQMQVYQAEDRKALAATAKALEGIRRLPPGPERWNLTVQGELLHGQILRGLQRNEESDEAFRRILRLAPTYQLDPDYFLPSTRQRFEKLRKEVTGARKVKLDVKSLPSGAAVYLDGMKAGSTPQGVEVYPGSYEVLVVKDGLTSLPHPVDVRKETPLFVDLQFEGSIQLDRDPCIAGRGDERGRLSSALRIATLLGVDDLVVLRLDRMTSGPHWLAASVLNTATAQKLREGGLKVKNAAQEPEGLAELANFIVTGQASAQVLEVGPAAPASPARGAGPPVARAADLGPFAPPPDAPPAFPRWPGGWRGPAVLALGGGGAALTGAGILLLSLGNATMDQSNAFLIGGRIPTDEERALLGPMRDAARLEQAAAIGAMGLGGAALLAGAVLYFVDPFAASAVVVTADGAGAAVRVSW